jgi:hypothetical protein
VDIVVPHEQVAPETVFSVAALSQLQLPAGFAPQEQVASAAQEQVAPERPQQAFGAMDVDMAVVEVDA